MPDKGPGSKGGAKKPKLSKATGKKGATVNKGDAAEKGGTPGKK